MRHLLLALLLGVATTPTIYGQSPTVATIELGTPEADSQFGAIAINASGVVVGTLARDGQVGDRRFAVYTWTRSGGFRLILDNAMARDINDSGVVVGSWRFCADDSCLPRGFVWTPAAGVRDLGTMTPVAINNRRDIAGYCGDLQSACVRSGTTTRRLPDTFSAFDINERGIVAGFDRPGTEVRAAIWGSGLGLRQLDQMPGPSAAYAINDGGLVAGEGAVPASPHGFREQAAVWTPVGRAGDTHFNSYAFGLSNRGWIVGQAQGRPALWLLGGRLITLPIGQAQPSSGHTARDVNDAGHIVGTLLVGDQTRSVVWIVS